LIHVLLVFSSHGSSISSRIDNIAKPELVRLSAMSGGPFFQLGNTQKKKLKEDKQERKTDSAKVGE
jgi:hypothetical protein